VNETVYATEVYECTEVDDRRNDTLTDLTLLEVNQEGAAALGLSLLKKCTARKNNVVTVLVQLEDLGFDVLAEVRSEVANATKLDERCRKESTQTDVYDQTTLNNFDNRTGNDAVCVLDLFNIAPCTLVLCALLGEDEATFFVFLLKNECLNGVANLDYLRGVNVVLDGKFTRRDNTFGLVANVKENLVAIYLDNGAFNEVTIVEKLEGLFDSGEEVLSRTDVVDCNLSGCLLCYKRHVKRAPVFTYFRPSDTANC
jgi:hypothetical protein